jgi:hypothetical protein
MYYTTVAAATLLLKLALVAEWGNDFGDPVVLADFKVADLACGTGTLPMASVQAFADAFIQARTATDRPLEVKDLSTLHRILMENLLHGYDVLPSAVHLTTSTLAPLAPEVAFVKMNLFVVPMGVDHGKARLGSLDFLTTDEIRTQMTLDRSHVQSVRVGAATMREANAKVPKLNLCVMNPPFVRSVGGNLLFGFLPKDERAMMQNELKRRVKTVRANVTAGLGSVFLALADCRLAAGGRLAFVLPASLASGEAWAVTRQLISDRYHLETVVSSHDPERPNFSENTSLSELLLIARRLKNGETVGNTTYVNLWRNPRSIYEAMDLAHRIGQAKSALAMTAEGFASLQSGSGKIGEVIAFLAPRGEEKWIGAMFAQAELAQALIGLREGTLHVPGIKKGYTLPLCLLRAMGSPGPDVRRIWDGFKATYDDWTPYAAFWGHKSEEITCLDQVPNARLRVWVDSPRGADYGVHLWEQAGNILIAERLRSNAHRVVALRFAEPLLSNTWWSLRPHGLSETQEKALLLWLNSSLSILLLYANRVVTEGAWFKLKQPAWESMPVLDVRELSAEQVGPLASTYDSLRSAELLPLARLDTDPARRRIDEALSEALGLPKLSAIRELLAREAGLTALGVNEPARHADLEEDEVEDDD